MYQARNGFIVGMPLVMQRRSGLGLLIGEAARNANQATRSVSDIGTGASIGATVGSAVPIVGTAIGAAVGAVVGVIGSLFGPAKEGQAAETWDDMVNHGYLFSTPGTGFDERYFGEALKGAMDKGNNVWPGCGGDGYKNPDCFYAPLARVIINGYLNKAIPLTATPSQVYSVVVQPWLQSGASGLFNWANYSHEGTQNQALLIKAAVDRYVNGLPITRANMPAYGSQAGNYTAWSTPSITTALASLLTPQKVTAAVAATPPAPQPPVVQSNSGAAVVAPASTPPKSSAQPVTKTSAMVVPILATSVAAPAATPITPTATSPYYYNAGIYPVGAAVPPAGATLLSQAQYDLLALQGSSPAAIALWEQLTGQSSQTATGAASAAQSTPVTAQPTTITITAPDSTPVAAPATDNTMLYAIGAGILLIVLMNKK